MRDPAPLPSRVSIQPLRSLSIRLPLIVAGSLLLMALVSAGIGYFTTRQGLADVQDVNLRTQAGIQATAIERELREHASRMGNFGGRQSFADILFVANTSYSDRSEAEIAQSIQQRADLWDASIQVEEMSNAIIDQVINNDISQNELAPESVSVNESLGLTNHYLLLDSQGLVVATSQPDNLPENIQQSDTTWWQTAVETKQLYISPPYTPLQTPVVTIMDFALPILDEDGNLSGLLYSSFDYNAVKGLIRQTQAADSSRTALADANGNILFTSSILSGLAQATDIPLAAASESLSLYEGPNDELFVVAAEQVESSIGAIEALDWYVAAIQSEEDAFAPIDDAVSIGLLTAAIVGIIIIVGLFVLYIRPLTSSLDNLRVSAQSLQEGKLGTRVNVSRQDELGLLGTTFNQMADQLISTIEEQETTIASRTADLQRRAAQLETATLVGQAASASLDLETLMADTVNLIRDKFDYYHASIFLLDDVREFAVVRESTGEIGQKLKAQSHRLAVGSNSIVGWVTRHHQPRIALNVGEDAIHFNNPLLPRTQSEVALPLISQTQLLGALDVQSTEKNAFDENDLAVLQLMADQVAGAIYNARLFGAVQDQSKQRRQVIDLWQQLNTLRTTADILETTCQNIFNKVGYDAVIAVLVDGTEWHVTTSTTASADLAPPTDIRRPIGSGIIGQSIMLRKPILQSDEVAAGDLYDLDFPKVAGRASAPILIGDEAMGAIVLYSTRPGQLDENDLSLLEIITTTVSSAVSNARLLTETEKNLEEINRLYQQTIQGYSGTEIVESVYEPARVRANGQSANQINIPLVSRGRQIGEIEIIDREDSWSSEEEVVSNAIANQVALALENSSYFNLTQTRLKETEALFNLSKTLASTLDVRKIYELAAKAIARTLDASRCAISSWQREDNILRDEADYILNANNQIVDVFDKELVIFDLANHAGTTKVLNEHIPLIRHRSDPDLEMSEKELLFEYGLGVCLEIPMVSGNNAHGVIEVYRENEAQSFSDYEINLAMAMANQTASVLSNAELAAESTSRLAELSTLNRLSETLALASDLHSIFSSAQKEIMNLLNATGVAISLLDDANEKLNWIYIYEQGQELDASSVKPTLISEGFSGFVVRNSKPVLENQITAETMIAYDSEVLAGGFAAAYMGLPLRVANRTIGVLGIENNDSPDAFSQDDLRLMETIAGTLGIAIENQRLLERTQEALSVQSQQSLQLQAATEVSAASSSILDREQLISTAVNLIQDRFGLYYVGLFIIDQATNQAWLRAGTGDAGRIQLENKHHLAVSGQSLIGGATGDGRPRIVQDVTDDAEWRPNPILPHTRSELALPMRVRERIIGALTVQSTQPNEFGSEFVSVLQAMADQLAIAIENTRLLSEAQSRANRQHVLNEVSTQLHRSRDMNTIIDIGLQALSEHLDGANIKLRLGQSTGKKNGA